LSERRLTFLWSGAIEFFAFLSPEDAMSKVELGVTNALDGADICRVDVFDVNQLGRDERFLALLTLSTPYGPPQEFFDDTVMADDIHTWPRTLEPLIPTPTVTHARHCANVHASLRQRAREWWRRTSRFR
jgi:hypothetical protein